MATTSKTTETDASVDDYLAAIDDEVRRDDCRVLARLMSGVTRQPPRMWGTGIVGFGSYHYRYESGREGDAPLTGFAARKGDISVYLVAGFEGREALLARLGRHKTGKACLYVRRLSDVDMQVLEQLVAGSVEQMRKRYP
jgi:hypothetical protein